MFASRILVFTAYKPIIKKWGKVNRLPTTAGYSPIMIIPVNVFTVSDEENFDTIISDAKTFGHHKYL